jgi:hypothetical protein
MITQLLQEIGFVRPKSKTRRPPSAILEHGTPTPSAALNFSRGRVVVPKEYPTKI